MSRPPNSPPPGRPPYPVELFDGDCPCAACVPADADPLSFRAQVNLCPTCGNKRCPGAVSHADPRRPCSGSNRTDQPGSFGGPPLPEEDP